MPAIPTNGDASWGTELNNFLEVALSSADGTLVTVTGLSTSAPTTPISGAAAWCGSNMPLFRMIDGLDYGIGPASKFLTSQFAGTTGTSAQNVTGMSVVLGIGTYHINGQTNWVPAGTTGSTHKTGFTYSGSATGSIGLTSSSGTGSGGGASATITTTIASATHTASGGCDDWDLYLVAATGGTLQMQITNTTSADQVTLLAGTMMQIYRTA